MIFFYFPNKKDVCNNVPNPCGTGALCQNQNGTAICSCPANKTGDPSVRCCGRLLYFLIDFFLFNLNNKTDMIFSGLITDSSSLIK